MSVKSMKLPYVPIYVFCICLSLFVHYIFIAPIALHETADVMIGFVLFTIILGIVEAIYKRKWS